MPTASTTAAPRSLLSAAGTLSAASTNAGNGSQLNATNTNLTNFQNSQTLVNNNQSVINNNQAVINNNVQQRLDADRKEARRSSATAMAVLVMPQLGTGQE
ncbi:MAG: hypothetical protein EOO54_04655, partial [Haliea sp.]